MVLQHVVLQSSDINMKKEYVLWLKNYFSIRSTLPSNVEEMNYFEIGLINSLGVVELIESIEAYFEIRLDALHFQDRRFATINGLAEIIYEIKGRSDI